MAVRARTEVTMALIDMDNSISISEAIRLGVSGLVREAEEGRDQVVLRNNRPVAAVVGIHRLEELQQLEEDLLDVTLLTSRTMTTGERRHSLDDVLNAFGYSREQLRGLPD
jgi:prevent-host-death family protein